MQYDEPEMAPRPALLASFFTVAGAVRPFTPPLISPIPFRERAEAAGRAGFCGFGFGHEDLEHTLREHAYADVCGMLADNGIEYSEIELLRDWFSHGEQRRIAEVRHNFLFEAAAQLGAAHIKIGTMGGEYPLEHMIESFAALCDRAAEAGTGIALEISPVGRVPDLRTGVAIVQGAGRPNGGLLLDIWHVTRARIDFPQIAALAPNVIRHVELDDGPLEQQTEYLEETTNRRRLCGQGEFDLGGFLSAVAATGYNRFYGVEILSDENRSRSAAEAARLAFDTAMSQFTRGRSA